MVVTPAPRRLNDMMQTGLGFVRTPSLARNLAGLMTLALLCLLVINIVTFAMIRQTADYSRQTVNAMSSRVISEQIMTLFVDAETGHRGFLLTQESQYLIVHDRAMEALPGALADLDRITVPYPDQNARVQELRALAGERLARMSTGIDLARAGRLPEAVALLRTGQGKVLMDAMRAKMEEIDAFEQARVEDLIEASERSGRITLAVNTVGGVFIIVLAIISLMLIRRYLAELARARDMMAQANELLESKVAERTTSLRRANDEIQRFAYIVSHDLRAPLVNVMGYTSELEEAGKALTRQIEQIEASAPELLDEEAVQAVREDVPEAIGFVRASTAKMDRLINAILKLSREGRRRLVSEPVSMTDMVRNIADSVNHQTEAANAEIVVASLPDIESDRLSLEQIFGNLIDNAVKYLDHSREGLIHIDGRTTSGGMVEYRIRDNGRGIDPKDHERIFELFRRSGRQDRQGEGLGLAFVRNAVRRLGGDIRVESELGKGSTFYLVFPKRLVIEQGEGE
jgi:signal transduction histidine kinase